MRKLLSVSLFSVLLLAPVLSLAGSSHSDGDIDQGLKYEGFQITDDGFVTGYIVNTAARTRSGLRLDMWTTNIAETRIFWRKSLQVGDLAPGAKYQVREPYQLDGEDPDRIEFKFRLPHKENYRNSR
ncbi:MAG: hypothetical protein AB2L11_13820 [Syntrophobacteraceae bacterium]